MPNTDERISELEKEIASLPVGYISKKTINGKVRYYRQWTENGKTKSQYIRENEFDGVSQAIERRKELQEKLKELNKNQTAKEIKPEESFDYETNIVIGEALQKGCNEVRKFQKRDCFKQLEKYLYGKGFGRVCVVYGLRRTGKTTMLFQAMSELPLEQTAYIKIQVTDTMGMLNRDLKKLSSRGYRYVFIDEVTLMEDFIDSAALFSDIYAMQGMKIVLSGTDSLGFWFAEHDKAILIVHRTSIPLRANIQILFTAPKHKPKEAQLTMRFTKCFASLKWKTRMPKPYQAIL